MAKEVRSKFDPNKEAFQMRDQWKKIENCRQQWRERWMWLLDERKRTEEEINAIRQEAAAVLPDVGKRVHIKKSLKPVPATTTGVIGWLSSKPDCQLEIYTPWLTKIPVRLPNTWDNKDYLGSQSKE